MTVLYVLLALLLLGIMVTAHELGHFLAARACGIAVRSFGIGFGPRLLRWQGKKSGTEYSLRLIPGGGFCAFYGEDDAEGKVAREDPRALTLQPAWKRLITIAAGPLMNFVLAYVVATLFFLCYGLPYDSGQVETVIVSVEQDSPAETAGLREGDVVTHADGEALNGDLSERIIAWTGRQPLQLTVNRDGEQLTLSLTPRMTEEGRYAIGITMNLVSEPLWLHEDFGTTAAHAANVCVSAGTAVLRALGRLVTRGEGVDQLSGPVGVIDIIAQETQTYRLMGYLNMLILISINLGLMNLLPIPGLDGCRIVFVLIEMIFRRPVNRRVEASIHLAGYLLLFGLMLFFTFHDVLRIFG